MGKEIIKTEKKENVRWNIGKQFLQVPHLLIDYHEELGIDEKELLFLIKLSRHKETFKVHDSKVVKGCQKTAQRRRASLRKKGLLYFEECKRSYMVGDEKRWETEGFFYDFSIINRKLQELGDSIEEDNTVSPEDKTVPEEDHFESIKGHQSPPKNTMQNTIYNSSTTPTIKTESSYAKIKPQIDASKFQDILDAYKSNVDASYIVQPRDLMTLEEFDYPDRLLKYIPYWTQFNGTHKDFLHYANNVDGFDKKHSAQIHVIIKHWNNFNKYAENKIQSEKKFEEVFGEKLNAIG